MDTLSMKAKEVGRLDTQTAHGPLIYLSLASCQHRLAVLRPPQQGEAQQDTEDLPHQGGHPDAAAAGEGIQGQEGAGQEDRKSVV